MMDAPLAYYERLLADEEEARAQAARAYLEGLTREYLRERDFQKDVFGALRTRGIR